MEEPRIKSTAEKSTETSKRIRRLVKELAVKSHVARDRGDPVAYLFIASFYDDILRAMDEGEVEKMVLFAPYGETREKMREATDTMARIQSEAPDRILGFCWIEPRHEGAADELERAITDEKLEKASAKDLGILAAIGTDKLLLLQGLPTQIVRTERDRTKLGDLAEALALEMGRRGVKLDGVPTPAVLDVKCERVDGGTDAST